MKHITKRFLSLLLTLAMVLPMAVFPMPAVAAQTVTPDPLTGVMRWDFSDASQLSDFTLYQSGTSNFTLQDGILRPTGADGEMKAMLNADVQDIESLSVDIIPGQTLVNSGIYVGASNVGNTAGQIDALAILVESMCTGWPDAPNRIDIVTGSFSPWKETGRVLSETGNGNALYKNGVKKPVNLRLDFGSDNIMITLSLVEDPSKTTQSVYYCNPAQMQGQIGLRSQFSDVGFDNLQIKLDRKPQESLKQGLSFTGTDSCVAQTDGAVSQIPNTIEMWVKMNPRINSSTLEYRQPLISSLHPNGSASPTAGDFALITNASGNLWWYEVTDKTISDTTSQATNYEWRMISSKNHWTGQWMHIALTRQEGNVTLYVNGEFVYTWESAALGYAAQPTHPISFGYSSLVTGKAKNNLNGSIGDVRLWSTTRTQAQICGDMFSDISAQQEGLMHYWKFDEQAGTAFYDSVSNGLSGTIAPAVGFEKKEAGLEFSGINEAVATIDAPVANIPQALEFWVKIDPDTEADQETLIAAYSGQTQANAKSGDWYLGTSAGGGLRWVEKNANGESGQMNGKTNIRTGEWTHIAVVRYEGDIKFYINGVEDTVTKHPNVEYITLDSEKTKSSTCPTLGYCVYNTIKYTNFLDGAIKDVRIWDTDRTQEQIVADMNKTLTGQEEGLLHYWKLDESHGKVITDTAGNTGGTITGNTTSWIGQAALHLPGVNQPIAVAHKAVSSIPQTVELWVKISSDSAAKIHPLVSAYNAKTQVAISGDWQLDIKSGRLRWVDMTGKGKSGQLLSSNTNVIAKDEWVHVAVTREDGSVKFYINGQLDATNTYTMFESSTPSYTAPVFGYSIFDTASNTSYLDGSIRDVRIWSVTRSAEEIARDMDKTLTGNEAGLMNYWKMDEQDGVIFEDSTASANHGAPTVYWSTQVSEPEEAPKYTNDGFNFYEGKKWETTKKITQGIASVDAWVKVPEGTADDSRLTILSGWPYSNFTMDIYTNGRPRLYYTNASGVGTHYIANVDLRTNEWTHVAWTCDSTTGIITCYINGVSVYTNNSIGGHVSASTLYVGRDDRSGWQYPFIGQVADIRVWNKTLSAQQVQYSMQTSQLTQADGLFLNLPLDEAANAKTLHDVSGNENHVEVWERVLTWLDVEKQPSDYSFVILPDQQILTHYYPEKLNNMYQWIADKVEEENIQAVINVGDITDDNSILHWERAKTAYNIIDGKVPFIPVVGNHDYDTTKTYRDLTNMNQYFPISLMANQGTQSGFYSRDKGLPDDVANHWQAFEVQGNKYIVVALEFGPRDSVLAWANEVIAAHPDHQAIIVTHGYITHDGTWLDGTDAHVPSGYGFTKGEAEPANNADAVWEKLVSKQPNIIMVLSGHILKSDNVVSRVDISDHGNEVVQFLIDGQNLDGIYGGFGLVAMMNFRDDGQTVEFTYYATDKGKYMNAENQFTFTLPAQKAPAAQVGSATYPTVTEAVQAANGETVTILADSDEAITISKDVTIDLAGHTLSNVTVNEGATLYGIDTTTDDYDCTDGYGKITNLTGNFALHHQTVVNDNPQRYLAVTEEDGVSFHRFYLGIQYITLRPGKVGFGYKAIFGGDEKVKASLAENEAFGYNLWITEDKVVSCGSDADAFVIGQCGTPLTLCLSDFDTKNYGEAPVYATVYITLADGTTITSAEYSYSMRTMVERINENCERFTETQLNAVANMILKDETMQKWDVANILESLNSETP